MAIACIGKIVDIQPIEKADKISQATVVCGKSGKWQGVVQKGTQSIGDLVEVYLQDALLPQNERFAFMEKCHWRVRIMRLRGALSECLIMPLSITGEIGDDIVDTIGVMKYEKPLPANMSGDILGHFPSFIPKTDEPNFQAVPEMAKVLWGRAWVATEKEDGSSATIYKYEGHFGCCSRNYELKPSERNAIWQIAKQYELENSLPDGIAIQFEVVGPGIQSNPMGLKQVEPRTFNVWDIGSRQYLLPSVLHLPIVPEVARGDSFSFNDEELRELSGGLYPNGRQREGIVIRPHEEMQVAGERLSFKVVNPNYEK